MIRTYRETAEKILLALLYLQNRQEDALSKARGWGIDNFYYRNGSEVGVSPKVSQTIARFVRTKGGEEFGSTELEQLIGELAEQVEQDYRNSDASHDGDLIEHIVKIFNLPYPKNALVANLGKLKKALLLPAEMAALNQSLKERELSCAHCHRKLHSNELVTIYDEGSDRILLCARCHTPLSVACSQCKNVAPISKQLRASLKKGHDCGIDHSKHVVEPEAEVLIGDDDGPAEILRDRDERDRGLAMPRYRGGGVPIAAPPGVTANLGRLEAAAARLNALTPPTTIGTPWITNAINPPEPTPLGDNAEAGAWAGMFRNTAVADLAREITATAEQLRAAAGTNDVPAQTAHIDGIAEEVDDELDLWDGDEDED